MMKIIKCVITLLVICFLLLTSAYAEETNCRVNVNVRKVDATVEETELISDTDNSNLPVVVIKITDGKETIIYNGVLGGYSNGIWAFTDFSDIDFLLILDWNTLEREAIYIIPATKINSNKILTATDIIRSETGEQTSPVNSTQLIEYDVTYIIVSNDSLSMDIDYNVYNKSSANETVSLIAALYEDGRLSDIKTKSLSVNALQNKTDSIILPLPDEPENYSVKLMVWEGVDNLKPIGEAKSITDLDNYNREKYIYITADANTDFNVYMNAGTVKGANTDAVHTLRYDSAKITPVDLCGFTYNKELTAGSVLNTNITVQNADLSAGRIEYKFNFEAGRNTGITNFIKFRTLSNLTDEMIIYTIQ